MVADQVDPGTVKTFRATKDEDGDEKHLIPLCQNLTWELPYRTSWTTCDTGLMSFRMNRKKTSSSGKQKRKQKRKSGKRAPLKKKSGKGTHHFTNQNSYQYSILNHMSELEKLNTNNTALDEVLKTLMEIEGTSDIAESDGETRHSHTKNECQRTSTHASGVNFTFQRSPSTKILREVPTDVLQSSVKFPTKENSENFGKTMTCQNINTESPCSSGNSRVTVAFRSPVGNLIGDSTHNQGATSQDDVDTEPHIDEAKDDESKHEDEDSNSGFYFVEGTGECRLVGDHYDDEEQEGKSKEEDEPPALESAVHHLTDVLGLDEDQVHYDTTDGTEEDTPEDSQELHADENEDEQIGDVNEEPEEEAEVYLDNVPSIAARIANMLFRQ